MRRVMTFVLAVLLISGLLQAQESGVQQYRVVNRPGQLESTILRGAHTRRHELGSLTPPGTVRFIALIATDPVSHVLVRGLEVQLEGDDPFNGNRHCKDSVYLDEIALAELQERLEAAVKGEDYISAHISKFSASYLETPRITMAANPTSTQGVYYVPVQFGAYHHDGLPGLYIHAPHSEPTSGPHRTTQFLMPSANIAEVLKLVRDGREWLKQNAPTTAPAVN